MLWKLLVEVEAENKQEAVEALREELYNMANAPAAIENDLKEG